MYPPLAIDSGARRSPVGAYSSGKSAVRNSMSQWRCPRISYPL